MSIRCQLKWTQFLRKNGVHVKSNRGYARWKALSDCLLAGDFEPSISGTVPHELPAEEELMVQIQPENDDVLHTTKRGISAHYRQGASNQGANTLARIDIHSQMATRDSLNHNGMISQQPLQDPATPRQQNGNSFHSRTRRTGDQTTEYSSGYLRKNEVDSLMKAYISRSKFSSSFTEDFDG